MIDKLFYRFFLIVEDIGSRATAADYRQVIQIPYLYHFGLWGSGIISLILIWNNYWIHNSKTFVSNFGKKNYLFNCSIRNFAVFLILFLS